MPKELDRLLDRTGRMVLVYQHVRAIKVGDRVDEVLLALASTAQPVGWCSYESGTVALVCLSKMVERTIGVASHFRAMLGRHAKGRIRDGVLAS